MRRVIASLRLAAGVACSFLRQPAGRCHVWIVAAGAFICLYSATVLWRVMTAPDIGLSCSFSLNILRVFDGFSPPGDGEGPRYGDTILRLGDQDVDWQHFLRRLDHLEDECDEVIADESAGWPAAARAATEANVGCFRLRGET